MKVIQLANNNKIQLIERLTDLLENGINYSIIGFEPVLFIERYQAAFDKNLFENNDENFAFIATVLKEEADLATYQTTRGQDDSSKPIVKYFFSFESQGIVIQKIGTNFRKTLDVATLKALKWIAENAEYDKKEPYSWIELDATHQNLFKFNNLGLSRIAALPDFSFTPENPIFLGTNWKFIND